MGWPKVAVDFVVVVVVVVVDDDDDDDDDDDVLFLFTRSLLGIEPGLLAFGHGRIPAVTTIGSNLLLLLLLLLLLFL